MVNSAKYKAHISEVVSLHQQKIPLTVIAQKFGVTADTVSHWLEKTGEHEVKHSTKQWGAAGDPMEESLTPAQCKEMRLFLVAAQWLYRRDKDRFGENVTGLIRNWGSVRREIILGGFGIKKEREPFNKRCEENEIVTSTGGGEHEYLSHTATASGGDSHGNL